MFAQFKEQRIFSLQQANKKLHYKQRVKPFKLQNDLNTLELFLDLLSSCPRLAAFNSELEYPEDEVLEQILSHFPQIDPVIVLSTHKAILDSYTVLEILRIAFPGYFKESPGPAKFKSKKPKKSKQGFWNKNVLRRYDFFVTHKVKGNELYDHYLKEPQKQINMQIQQLQAIGYEYLEAGDYNSVESFLEKIRVLQDQKAQIQADASGKIFSWLNEPQYHDLFVDLHGQPK